MKIMSYFKWTKMRSQSTKRSMRSRRILRDLICFWCTFKVSVDTFLERSKSSMKSIHTRPVERWTFEQSSVPSHESHMSALVPKLDLWIFKDVIAPLMGPYLLHGNVGTSDGRIFSITFGSCGSQALGSVTTQLATWRIATFSEIVSCQYAMAYDTCLHDWSHQPWILAGKTLVGKKFAAQNWGVIWMRG
jgi:hypothetical protein